MRQAWAVSSTTQEASSTLEETSPESFSSSNPDMLSVDYQKNEEQSGHILNDWYNFKARVSDEFIL